MKRRVIVRPQPQAQSGLEVKMNNLRAGQGLNSRQMPWQAQVGKLSAPDVRVNSTLQPVPREEANLEAERGEVAALPTKSGIPDTFKIGGKRHHSGGTPLNLPSDSFIFSDTAKMKIKDVTVLAQFGMPEKAGGYTPAEIAKKYDVNAFKKILADPESDKLQKQTAEMMIANYNLKLAKLAIIQESMKGFPQGIPMIAMPYIEEMEIDPAQFVQMNPGGADDEQAETQQGEMDDEGAEAQGRFGGYMKDGGSSKTTPSPTNWELFKQGFSGTAPNRNTWGQFKQGFSSAVEPLIPDGNTWNKFKQGFSSAMPDQNTWNQFTQGVKSIYGYQDGGYMDYFAPGGTPRNQKTQNTQVAPYKPYGNNMYGTSPWSSTKVDERKVSGKKPVDIPDFGQQGYFDKGRALDGVLYDDGSPYSHPKNVGIGIPFTGTSIDNLYRTQPDRPKKVVVTPPKKEAIPVGFEKMSDYNRLIKVAPEAYAHFQKAFKNDYKTPAGKKAMLDMADELDRTDVKNSWGWLPWSAQDDLQNLAGILRERAAGNFGVTGDPFEIEAKKRVAEDLKVGSEAKALYSALLKKKAELQKKDPYSLEVLNLSNDIALVEENLSENVSWYNTPDYTQGRHNRYRYSDPTETSNLLAGLSKKYPAVVSVPVDNTNDKKGDTPEGIAAAAKEKALQDENIRKAEEIAKAGETGNVTDNNDTETKKNTQKKKVTVTPPAAATVQPDADGLYEVTMSEEQAKRLGF